MTPVTVLASAAGACAVGLLLFHLVPPPRRLRGRVEPYVAPSLIAVGSPDRTGPVRTVFGPIVKDAADALGRLIDHSGSAVTLLKLRQAGLYRGMPDEQMLSAYRLRQLRSLVVSLVIASGVGQLIGASFGLRVVLIVLGAVVGVTRERGRLTTAIEKRREAMKIEIYTVNQLLALRVRAGGGVIQAIRAVTERGSGEVVTELAEALRLHRSGWRGSDALRRIAELTPEPFCSRTYRLLASAEERGADLAGALLSLSEDVRETRRESIKRTATKRRAAMLVPTIAILAPVLILFVAAPLPYLITGWQ
ncbi:MAG TPA: type II secretion system F family protein [Acidimicrobiia bacterium]|nr:type II secretion system F family protein [Acidimicrobiia bacterium]